MDRAMEVALQQGGFAVVAVVALVMLNTVWKVYTADLRNNRADLIVLIKENSTVLASLLAAVAEFRSEMASLRAFLGPKGRE